MSCRLAEERPEPAPRPEVVSLRKPEVWAALDLLLTCETISNARDRI
jgi:hypothetical protein